MRLSFRMTFYSSFNEKSSLDETLQCLRIGPVLVSQTQISRKLVKRSCILQGGKVPLPIFLLLCQKIFHLKLNLLLFHRESDIFKHQNVPQPCFWHSLAKIFKNTASENFEIHSYLNTFP